MKKKPIAEFYRVSYGSEKTPKKSREYRIMKFHGLPLPLNQRPVGTRSEIRNWLKERGIPLSRVKIYEKKLRGVV